jgi:hypothetical protein
VVGNTVLIGSKIDLLKGSDNTVHALYAATGEVKWQIKTGAHVRSSPTVTDETVFVGSNDKRIYAIDLNTGEKLWYFETDGFVRSSPTVFDGTLFFGSNDNHLYKLDTDVGSSSEGSRVMLGTLGHHSDWEYGDQTINKSSMRSTDTRPPASPAKRKQIQGNEQTASDSMIPDISSVSSPSRRNLTYGQVKEGKLIGSGGQSVVRRVILSDEKTPQKVAVKEPQQPAKTVGTEEIESFFDEARTWKALDTREREKPMWENSEHIVGVVDVGEDLPWLAMEYMDGRSLADRLNENPDGLPLDQALWISKCLCRGAKLAHDYGIAHLDIKPANILFRKTGDGTWDVPKIADWGLSRVLINISGSVDALSFEYAAPEQFDSSQFGDPDKYTDIYQLGAVVYALLTDVHHTRVIKQL